jgi:hypothetical protein
MLPPTILLLKSNNLPAKSTIMKKIWIAILIFSIAACTKKNDDANTPPNATGCAVEDKNPAVPNAVTTAFKAKFGNIAVCEWKLRNEGTWKAHFFNKGVAWEATFNADGSLVKSEPA